MKKGLLKDLFSKNMLIIFFLGFSSGLPLLIIGSTLKTWLSREHIDLSVIGFFSWVGMSYSLKFLWAPLLDRFALFKMGRRRSWMMFTQASIMILVFFLGTLNPNENLALMAGVSILIAFFSATQDIAIDAYRRELLSDEELGLGSSINIYGYRIAMLLSGGLGIGLVGGSFINLSWHQLYYILACFMSVGLVTSFFCKEPPDIITPKTLKAAVIDPLKDFIKRREAWFILLFVMLYKLGDAVGLSILNPYYVEMGFSNASIGLIAKTFGLASTLVGFFLGGIAIYYFGIIRCLWIFGVLQALSTASFALLLYTGAQDWALAVVVLFEDISTSMASAAFVAYIAAICNRQYTATQYAILSSLATLGRNFFSGFAGGLVKMMGWEHFFYFCTILAVPGLIMLYWINRQYNAKSLNI